MAPQAGGKLGARTFGTGNVEVKRDAESNEILVRINLNDVAPKPSSTGKTIALGNVNTRQVGSFGINGHELPITVRLNVEVPNPDFVEDDGVQQAQAALAAARLKARNRALVQ